MNGSGHRRILFVTATRIGDAVLSTGLLDWLHRRHPDARFTVACGPVPAPLFAEFPFVERVLPMVKRKRAGHWLTLWRAVAGTWWDCVVDLRGSALAWLVPTMQRRVSRSSWVPEHRLRHLGRLFALAEPPLPRLFLSAASMAEAAALMAPGGAVLGVGPAANWGGKIWPADKFAAAIARLTAPSGPLPGARVAVFGAPDERALVAPVLEAIPAERRLDLVGAAALPTIAACLARCALYVGNDSGLMHISAAVETPTLGLFGPSSEVFYGPTGPRCASIRGSQSFEDICHAADYDHRRGDSLMGDLAVDHVVAAAARLLAFPPAAP